LRHFSTSSSFYFLTNVSSVSLSISFTYFSHRFPIFSFFSLPLSPFSLFSLNYNLPFSLFSSVFASLKKIPYFLSFPYLFVIYVCLLAKFILTLQDEISWLLTRLGWAEMRRCCGRYPPSVVSSLAAANTAAARRLPSISPLLAALRGIRCAVKNVKARAFL
jgi:hypothetical protein